MNMISIQLQRFVYESICPVRFSGKPITDAEFDQWKAFLAEEITAVKLAVSASPLSCGEYEQKYICALITQAVDLSNAINSYLFKKSVWFKNHPQAGSIKAQYQYSLDLFEGLILYLNALFPYQAGNVKISHSELFETIPGLKKLFNQLSVHLQDYIHEKELTGIVLSGISQLIHKKNITRNDAIYIESLITFLLNGNDLDNRHLADLLIIHDFNVPAFYRYYVHNCKARLNDIPGLHEQKEMLMLEKDRLFDLTTERGLLMPFTKRSLCIELNEFLNEKYTVAVKRIKLRRVVIRDNEKAKAEKRFLINLPVPQFGLFIRMQIEKGLLSKENLGELFTFFATHFYTPNTLYISPDSLQKKSTDVEFATAQKLKGQLIGMLNWLNSNHNLSNYN